MEEEECVGSGDPAVGCNRLRPSFLLLLFPHPDFSFPSPQPFCLELLLSGRKLLVLLPNDDEWLQWQGLNNRPVGVEEPASGIIEIGGKILWYRRCQSI